MNMICLEEVPYRVSRLVSYPSTMLAQKIIRNDGGGCTSAFYIMNFRITLRHMGFTI